MVVSQPSMRGTPDSDASSPGAQRFAAFIGPAAVTLRRALVARNGVVDGCEAAAEAVAWAWAHRDDIDAMSNPIGYLYRVGQSSLERDRRLRRLRVDFFPEIPAPTDPEFDEELFDGLTQLTPDQRTAVVLVHMYAFSYREVAEILGASEVAVTNYVHRGLKRLRQILG